MGEEEGCDPGAEEEGQSDREGEGEEGSHLTPGSHQVEEQRRIVETHHNVCHLRKGRVCVCVCVCVRVCVCGLVHTKLWLVTRHVSIHYISISSITSDHNQKVSTHTWLDTHNPPCIRAAAN